LSSAREDKKLLVFIGINNDIKSAFQIEFYFYFFIDLAASVKQNNLGTGVINLYYAFDIN